VVVCFPGQGERQQCKLRLYKTGNARGRADNHAATFGNADPNDIGTPTPPVDMKRVAQTISQPLSALATMTSIIPAQEVQAIGASVHGFEIGVSTVSLWGWPSNLLLIGRRLER